MPILVPFGTIVRPQHLRAFVFNDPKPDELVQMEVYTGWIPVGFAAGGLSVQRDEVVSFLPLTSQTIQQYTRAAIIDQTVSAAVSAVADDDDEANVEAVDQASVKLEHQGIGTSSPEVLILRATVAALNATIHGVTYQVTVMSTLGGSQPLNLDPDTLPAQ